MELGFGSRLGGLVFGAGFGGLGLVDFGRALRRSRVCSDSSHLPMHRKPHAGSAATTTTTPPLFI